MTNFIRFVLLMDDFFAKNISIVFKEIKKDFRVTSSICFGRENFGRIECAKLSDFAYGEYLFFIKNVPTYYFNALNSSLEGTTLKKWIDDNNSGLTIWEQMLLLFREAGIEHISLFPCSKTLQFSLGKSRIKQFSILEIREIKFY